MEECGLLFRFQAHLQLPFYIGQAHLPRDSTTHSGLGPSTSISNLENVPQTHPQAKSNIKKSSLIANFSSQAHKVDNKD